MPGTAQGSPAHRVGDPPLIFNLPPVPPHSPVQPLLPDHCVGIGAVDPVFCGGIPPEPAVLYLYIEQFRVVAADPLPGKACCQPTQTMLIIQALNIADHWLQAGVEAQIVARKGLDLRITLAQDGVDVAGVAVACQYPHL